MDFTYHFTDTLKLKKRDRTSAVTQRLRVEVVIDELLPLDDVLRVVAVIDRAGHFLLLFVVHLGVDVTTWQLSER